jgi:hypothetical protein
MKRIPVLLLFLITAACARKVDVRAPEVVRTERYAYVKDSDGRLYVITVNSKDFNDAMKKIRPGPASVDKLDLWVVTPMR